MLIDCLHLSVPLDAYKLTFICRSDRAKAKMAQGWLSWRIFACFSAIVCALVGYWVLQDENIDPTDYALRTERILSTTPLIDGHNDLPYLLRVELQNKIYDNKTFSFRNGNSPDAMKSLEP